jgi:hypothetical protein
MADTSKYRLLGRAFIDLTLLVAIVYLAHDALGRTVASSNRKADLTVVVKEARELYEAFDRYGEKNGIFPGTHAAPRFDPTTFDPLVRRGYYDGGIAPYLAGGRADGYGSPDERGSNREFWLELTLKSDPGVRLLVARSNDAPLGRGAWHDGVYLYRDGVLEPL